MVPVIKAVAAASGTFRDQVSYWAAEKLLFNIGRIPLRQSRQAVLERREAANLAAGQKRLRAGKSRQSSSTHPTY
jgi:hypothetical protein